MTDAHAQPSARRRRKQGHRPGPNQYDGEMRAQARKPARGERARPGGGMRAGYSRSKARDEHARAQLRPLAEGERPVTLVVASAVAGALAIAVLVGALTSGDLSQHGGSLGGGMFIAVVLGALAVNMHRRAYWAVLSFEALLAFQVVVATLALVLARTVVAAGGCVAAMILGGALFWKLVRVMARIQAADRGVDSKPSHNA